MNLIRCVRQSSGWSQQLTVLQVTTLVVGVVLVTVILLLAILLVRLTLRSQSLQTTTLKSQMGWTLNLLTQEQLRSQQLTNLLLSKDAMTYAALQAQTLDLTTSTNSSTFDGLTPVGTDEAEAARYDLMYGTEPLSSDVTDEFREYLDT